MPYPTNSYFDPSDKYRQTWSLVPQVRTVSAVGQKTRSLYSSLSPSIPLFYTFMLLAISFDIYLGFSILAKSGVNFALIIASVLADLLLAIAPFLVESFMVKDWNHVVIENRIFQKRLECQTMKKGESEKDFQLRRSNTITDVINPSMSSQTKSKYFRTVLILLIFAIACWKIYTYIKVLPPGLNIFSLVNGKIVLLFSILCAIFHILGSEKAFAHFMFWRIKGAEFKNHQQTSNQQRPNPERTEIEYVGEYINASSGNTSIVNENGKVYLEYINIIRDNEIQSLIDSQTSDDAKRGVAIKCKENQIIS
ncbi:MAG: hypothetical protein QE277_05665 [Flectobacillus sp.]|nr:hypothetical protein [Flectobacillus sp.]